MAFRFRRSAKVAPGVRLNVSKRGFGTSVGPRGAKLSVNSQGEVRKTVGLPGTGMSWTERSKLSGGDASRDPSVDEIAQLSPAEVSYLRGRLLRRMVGWVGAAIFVILILSGQGYAAGYLLPVFGVAWLLTPTAARLIWH